MFSFLIFNKLLQKQKNISNRFKQPLFNCTSSFDVIDFCAQKPTVKFFDDFSHCTEMHIGQSECVENHAYAECSI